MSDADVQQNSSGQSIQSGGRAKYRSSKKCAETLWQAALANSHTAKEVFWFAGGKPAEERPSDWLTIFTLKQVMIMPNFLRAVLGFDDDLEGWTTHYTDQAIKSAVGLHHETVGNISFQHVAVVLKQPSQNSAAWALASLQSNQDRYRDGVTRVLNLWRETAGGAADVTVGDLFDQEFKGTNAISQLRDAAIKGLKGDEARRKRLANVPKPIGENDDKNWLARPDSLEGAFTFAVDGKQDPRANQLSETASFLFGKDNGQALLNCHSAAMRGGLTALVAELFDLRHRERHDCHLPMLYIPLHGRSSAMPDDSLVSLIIRIRNFYARLGLESRKQQSEQPSGKPARMNADRMNQLIAETRDLMTRHPAILVFDGYRTQRHSRDARDYSLFHLRAAIAGDHVFDLIEQLLMIPTPKKAGEAIDVAAFHNSRFLITSDFPLFGSDGNALHPHPVLKLVAGTSIEIGLPAAAVIPEILPKFGNQSPAQLVLIRQEILGEHSASVDLFQSDFEAHNKSLDELAVTIFGRKPRSESIYGVLSTLLRLGLRAPYPALGDGPEEADLKQLLTNHLLPLLKGPKYDRWLAFLHFLAIAPGGLRPRTLARVYEDYCEVSGSPMDASERGNLRHEIATMLEACNGLIGLCRSDEVEALGDLDLPLLHRERYGFGRDEIPSERAIMFAFNEIRETLIQDACLLENGRYVSLLHLLLAEEAFDQCLQLSRYDDLHVDDSLHRHNRLFTALYHGAASLINEKLLTEPLHDGAGRFLSDDPKQRWIKLYTFAFRKMLDRPPLHALIRQYDAAGMKLDLLLLLLKPQLWRWQQGTPDLPERPSLDFEIPTNWKILRDFRADILKASSKTLVKLKIPPINVDGKGDNYEFRDRIERLITEMPIRPNSRSEAVNSIPEDILSKLDTGLAQDHDTRGKIEALAALTLSLVEGRDCADDLELQAAEYAARIGNVRSPKEMKILSDLINLYADATGVEADRIHRDVQVRRSGGHVEAVAEGFSKSFAAFYLAEAIRLRIFELDPTTARDTIGGSAGRGFIRVCLKLERQRQGWLVDRGHPFAGRGWFWMRAQKISADLTRYLSAYPRERAGMLILDSALARHCAPVAVGELDNGNIGFIEMALASLRKCEPIIQKLSKHSRLRQRFSLERSKVMAALARLYRSADLNIALQYVDLALADIDSVKKLAPRQNELWQGIASAQHTQLTELRSEILNACSTSANAPTVRAD